MFSKRLKIFAKCAKANSENQLGSKSGEYPIHQCTNIPNMLWVWSALVTPITYNFWIINFYHFSYARRTIDEVFYTSLLVGKSTSSRRLVIKICREKKMNYNDPETSLQKKKNTPCTANMEKRRTTWHRYDFLYSVCSCWCRWMLLLFIIPLCVCVCVTQTDTNPYLLYLLFYKWPVEPCFKQIIVERLQIYVHIYILW